jgi:hypothetical protein
MGQQEFDAGTRVTFRDDQNVRHQGRVTVVEQKWRRFIGGEPPVKPAQTVLDDGALWRCDSNAGVRSDRLRSVPAASGRNW